MRSIVILSCFLLVACDSPMNNRMNSIDTNASQQNKTYSLPQLNYQIEARWLSGPHGSLQKKSSLMIFLMNNSGELLDLDDEEILQFYASMPSMGHPLEDPGTFKKIDTGIYVNHDIQFNMPGDWLMEIWIMNQSFEIQDQVKWDEFL